MKKTHLFVVATLMVTLLTPLNALHAEGSATAGVDLTATQWGITAVRATEAWKITKGAGVTVAVLDTGVDGTHPDLTGRVLAGWSTISKKVLPVGTDSDVQSHGTHVSAIIAGDDDADGVVGVAPEATILPVQVLGSGGGSDLTVAEGIDWAVANGADVINMSLGGETSIFDKGANVSCEAVGRAFDAGVVVIVAAGNSGGSKNPLNRPASCRGAISVAALDENLDRTSFSSYDATVSISAPGRRIVSAIPTNNTFPFGNWDGTSMAAPFVAGVAALIRSAHPDWTAAQVVERMRNSATDLAASGVDPETGHGLVDAAAALGQPSRTAQATRSAIRAVAIPRITYALSDTVNTTARWEAPPGEVVTSYRLRHTSADGKITETVLAESALEGVVAADAWAEGLLVVVAVTVSGDRVSFPFNDIDIEFPVEAEVPQPIVTKVTTKWIKAGLEISFTATGPAGNVQVTFLDWNFALVADLVVPADSKKVVVPVEYSSEIRAHYGNAMVGNEGARVSAQVAPQFMVFGQVFTAGKGKVAVKGNTLVGCMFKKVGCQGALVEIIDSRTKRKLATARVLENLTFSAVFNRQPGTELVVVMNGRYRTPSLFIPTEGVRP